MGGFIMDHFIARERCKALIIMTKSYASLDLEYVKKVLRFESLEELRQFLSQRNSLFEDPNKKNFLICRSVKEGLEQSFASEFKKIDIKGQI
jgi:SAC3 family protein LENG8/THP3